MNYTEYLHIQSQIERMYDFHPDYFAELTAEEIKSLESGFLYNTPNELYPSSIEAYYKERISSNTALQQKMFDAAQKLYELSGSGDLNEDIKDIVSFKKSD